MTTPEKLQLNLRMPTETQDALGMLAGEAGLKISRYAALYLEHYRDEQFRTKGRQVVLDELEAEYAAKRERMETLFDRLETTAPNPLFAHVTFQEAED